MLDLADNQIENVSSLTGLSVLETLDLRNNDVMDVTPLSTMTHLKKLYLRDNANLSNLKYLVKLKEVSKTSIDITLPRPVTFRDDNLEADTANGTQRTSESHPRSLMIISFQRIWNC